MSSRFPKRIRPNAGRHPFVPSLPKREWTVLCVALVMLLACSPRVFAAPNPAPPFTELRICAETNNLPFSNERQEGFENKIAEILAQELHVPLHYTWHAQPRRFLKQTLLKQACDAVIGVPIGMGSVLTTRPYYRSSYVFVSRRADGTPIRNIDDPRLRRVLIGVQLVGDDQASTPPAHALARRGIVNNVRGYMLYTDPSAANPPARVIEAVANGEVAVAIAWGPLAGYFAPRQPVPLQFSPITPAFDPPGLPFTFAIAMGVRKNDGALRDLLQQALDARRADIERILDAYGVPRIGRSGQQP